MKVILVNGSPRADGCTFTALKIIQERLMENGIEAPIYQVGSKPVIGCTGCGGCARTGKCVHTGDAVNEVASNLRAADGLIVGSPVHYASASGAVTSFMDRLFYSMRSSDLKLKFGASVVSCRRGGASAAFDQLNKYFTISQMPVVSSCYWNMVHGFTPADVYADKEGVRTMQVLADNMAYLIKMKHAANLPLPEEPPRAWTNFVREDLLAENK
ncbi:MAG: flavodoxin family protein [Clostridia bacterium]|nr:flavodoxin family protein [Clostridia bacterium]